MPITWWTIQLKTSELGVAYWAAVDDDGKTVMDTLNSGVVELVDESDEDGARFVDRVGRDNMYAATEARNAGVVMAELGWTPHRQGDEFVVVDKLGCVVGPHRAKHPLTAIVKAYGWYEVHRDDAIQLQPE